MSDIGRIRIRYVDLHYKGIRIKQGWKNLFWDILLGLWGFSALIIFIFLFVQGGESLNIMNPPGNLGRIAKFYILPAILISGLFVLVTLVLCYPVWNYLADLQRLCRMIYTYPLYLVRNYVSSGAFDSADSVKVVREIEYFPRFFYRVKHGNVEITVELDGSQFHNKGDFENLSKVLEDRFVLNVVNIAQRREYLTYYLFRDAEQHRLNINDISLDGYGIPLMSEVIWQINKVPHALIVGATGGGKSYFLNYLIKAFLEMNAELYICDPKNSALADYGKVLSNVAVDAEEIQENVGECVSIMEERFQKIKEHEYYIPGQDFTSYDLPPVVLILDEYTAFVSSLDKKGKEEFKTSLSQIVLKGREAGVFVLLATQRPDASVVDGSIRDQLGLRVTLGSMSDDGYRMAFGTTEQKIKSYGGAGKGYVYLSGTTFVQKFCAPFVPAGYDFIKEAGKLVEVTNGGRKYRN